MRGGWLQSFLAPLWIRPCDVGLTAFGAGGRLIGVAGQIFTGRGGQDAEGE